MEGCRHVDVAFFEKLSVLACDLEIGLDDAHGGDAAEAYDDLRTQQGGLIAQPVHAGFLFLLQGVTVLRRAALDNICYVDICAAVEVDGGEVFIEQLTACTDERLALQIFVSARAFADEHNLRARVTHAEHDIGARFAQAAFAAVQAVFFQFFPVFKHISHRLFAFFQITVFSALSLS